MNYLLTGAEFNNKGAEAMTLVALRHIYENDKNAQVYIIDYYGRKMPFELINEIVFFELPFFEVERLLGRYTLYGIKEKIKDFIKFFIPGKKSFWGKVKEAKTILQSIDIMIDISGFSFSSKWGDADTIEFVNKIYLLKKYGAKIYLMSQSFGPFDYKKQKVLEYGRDALALCEKVYAREEEGYRALVSLGLNNVTKALDTVLVERNFEQSHLIKNFVKCEEDILLRNENNIGIIPNYRLIDRGGFDHTSLLEFYKSAIDMLIERYNVYLIAHAGEDMALCQEIKEKYRNDERVILISHVMLSFNYENFARKLDFIIASRYHSIIHAYKQFTPAIILGWADKYQDIAQFMNQEKYIINLKDTSVALDIVRIMESAHRDESKKIEKIMNSIKNITYYSFLENK